MNRLLAWGVSLASLTGAGVAFAVALDAHRLADGAAPVEVYDAVAARLQDDLPPVADVLPLDVLHAAAETVELGPATLPLVALSVAVVTAVAGAVRSGYREHLRRR